MRGPQYRPQNTIVLIIGTPNKVPVILGNFSRGMALNFLRFLHPPRTGESDMDSCQLSSILYGDPMVPTIEAL